MEKFLELEESYHMYDLAIDGIYFNSGIGLQLVYIVKGRVRLNLYEKNFLAEEGDFLLVNQCEARFLYGDGEGANYCLFLNIGRDYLRSLGSAFTEVRYENLIKADRLNKNLLKNFLLLYSMNGDGKFRADEENILSNIIRLLFKFYIDSSKLIYNLEQKKSYLYTINNMVVSEELGKINLRNIGKKSQLSQSYISKIFAEVVGLKFSEYVQQLKLYYASRRILNSSMSLDQVAKKVDFDSYKSLIRVFNKYLHMTPSEYRHRYKTRYQEGKNDLEGLVKFYTKMDYKNFVELTFPSRHIVIDYNKSKARGKIFQSWALIRNLQALGNDYMLGLDKISKDIRIKAIVLRFRYSKDGENIILIDLDREISDREFHRLLSMCVDLKIKPILYLDTGKLAIGEDMEAKFEQNLNIYNRFNRLLSETIGNSNIRKFSYTIDVSNIIDYINKPEDLMVYKKYIEKQQKILSNKLGSKDFYWGYKLGRIDRSKLKKFQEIYRNIGVEEICQPEFIYVDYWSDKTRSLEAIEDIKTFENLILEIVDDIVEIKEEINFPEGINYLWGLFRSLDITNMDSRYKDIFMISLMMRSTFMLFNENKRFLLDYAVGDKTIDSGYYNPKIIDELGYKRPLYWTLYLMSDIKGEVIVNEDGYIVIRNDRDFYVLIYGNGLNDYMYANKKAFHKIDEDKVDIKIKIRGYRGKYKVTSHRISYKNANPLYKISRKEKDKYLSIFEREYIKDLTVPGFTLDIREFQEDFEDIIEYSPFNIVLRKYIRI